MSAASQSKGDGTSLLSCPTDESFQTSALVGPLGGTVELGATKITIPSGALLAPTFIQVTIPASRYMEIDVSVPGLTSFLFNSPVSVTIDYSRCNRNDIDKQTLHVWHIDPSSQDLLEDMGGIDDKESRRITFTTGHLSGYAVAD